MAIPCLWKHRPWVYLVVLSICKEEKDRGSRGSRETDNVDMDRCLDGEGGAIETANATE